MRKRILRNRSLGEELCCASQFDAIVTPCELHVFDTTPITQPGLAMSPRELLNRVENGIVEVNAVFRGMENDDNDTETFPDEVVDLCSAGEFVKQGTEYLEARKAQLEAEQAEINAQLQLNDVKDNEDN